MFYAFSIFLQILMLVIGMYYTVISVVGCLFIKEEKYDNKNHKLNKFAVVIAAHNEEIVIANLVDSLMNVNYPKDSYDVFVVADNCDDQTAKIAGAHGANVYERFNKELIGKGYVLDWMFDKIFHMENKYDAFVVFDADNVVDPNFFTEMNIQLNKGYKAVQGYIDTKNPYDSWITLSYAISFWTINRLFQYARYTMGMCCQLCGTGFAVSTDIIKEIGWGATCLAEDMEFTMKLALNDYRVGWAHNAVVYDEKPLTFMQSFRQRIRWMQGHADVLSRFFFKLVKKGFKDKNFRPIDCALYLFQPIRIIALFFITFMGYAQTFYPNGQIGFFQLAYMFDSPVIWNTIVIIQLLTTPVVLALDGKMNMKVLKGYVAYYFYTFTWFPIAVMGLLNKDKKAWFHTQHTRKVTLTEIHK